VPHRAFGLYVHITWHTRLRQRSLRRADADSVLAAIRDAAGRWQVHVHEVAVLMDHVHIIASFRPEGCLVSFIRHAKSESARRINLVRGAARVPEVEPRGYPPWAPDLAVEVLAHDDHPADTLEKVAHWLKAGVRLVWVVDADKRTGRVYRADGSESLLGPKRRVGRRRRAGPGSVAC